MSSGTILESQTLAAELDNAIRAGRFLEAQNLAAMWIQKLCKEAKIGNLSSNEPDLSIILASEGGNFLPVQISQEILSWGLPFKIEIILITPHEVTTSANSDMLTLINSSSAEINLCAQLNLGAFFAKGEYIIFLDPEGRTDRESIAALYQTCLAYSATAVEGCIKPNAAETKGSLDEPETPWPVQGSMICLWNRDSFLAAGGFDVLSDSPAELAIRMYPASGPNAFLHQPAATLLREDKVRVARPLAGARLQEYRKYLKLDGTRLEETLTAVRRDPECRSLFLLSPAKVGDRPRSSEPLVSIITTARNAADFAEDYSRGIRNQTYQHFEIIFIDDGSTDATAEVVTKLWRNDSRFRLMRVNSIGRSAALNLAVKLSSGEICAIADADDIMLRERLARTVRYFEDKPDSACVSFYAFNEKSYLVGMPPVSNKPVSLRLRRHAGMPACFPTFAFKPNLFLQPFNESLTGGIDCDWIFRSLNANPSLDGDMMPSIVSYYRIHDHQISALKQDIQRDVAFAHVAALHASLIPFDLVKDRDTLLQLMGWMPVEENWQIARLYEYVFRFHREQKISKQSFEIGNYLLKKMQRDRLRDRCAADEKDLLKTLREFEMARQEWWEPQLEIRASRIAELEASVAHLQKEASNRHRCATWKKIPGVLQFWVQSACPLRVRLWRVLKLFLQK